MRSGDSAVDAISDTDRYDAIVLSDLANGDRTGHVKAELLHNASVRSEGTTSDLASLLGQQEMLELLVWFGNSNSAVLREARKWRQICSELNVSAVSGTHSQPKKANIDSCSHSIISAETILHISCNQSVLSPCRPTCCPITGSIFKLQIFLTNQYSLNKAVAVPRTNCAQIIGRLPRARDIANPHHISAMISSRLSPQHLPDGPHSLGGLPRGFRLHRNDGLSLTGRVVAFLP